ncbi:MAG TPA: CocE/NonD family hydrolase [Terriglobia bacterium]|nr:CocE/NonD family hydrolase [Terriglobia bacterium]
MTRRFTFTRVWLIALAVSIFTGPVRGQGLPRTDFSSLLDKTDAMIPMRDGVRLHTEIYRPKNNEEALPFLLERTPYGTHDDDHGYARALNFYKELIQDGYIVVIQDIRGRFKSEGQFVMLRNPREKNDQKAIDESTDTYDTVDWLLKNVPRNNGRVGVLGISYGGWLTVEAMIDPHPAIKAVSEQASPIDMFLGDDFHHNGAFRLSYGMEYVAAMEESNGITPFKFDKYDHYQWYLDLGALSNVNQNYAHGKLPTWNAFVEHPNYDGYWKKQSVSTYLGAPKVPNLNVAGWWDQEDFYGPVTIYEIEEKQDRQHRNYLAVGPWNHGGWAFSDTNGRKLGPLDFGSETSKYFREHIQAPWFAYWLKDQGSAPPEAVAFQSGTNTWKSYDSWPPRTGITNRKLYLGSNAKLSFDPPTKDEEFDSYTSDPANPVPYMPRPIDGSGWTTWLVQDQRFVEYRPDVLTWKTAVLTKDVTVAGDIVADLFASTTGTDSDWAVKLIDVYPEEYQPDPKMGGYELIIADEVFRGRFRRSFETPEPIVPGQVAEYKIDLHTNNHCFLKGHRIMVQVQSTWFPLIDRNPQKFVPNIFNATDSDYQKATQRVYRSGRFPSHVDLPIASQ